MGFRQLGLMGVVSAGLILGVVGSAGAVVQYTVTDLGFSYGSAYQINEAGQAVGYMGIGGGKYRGALWTGGTPTSLSTLVGNSYAEDLNDQGQIAGYAYADANNRVPHAVIWTHGVLQDLNAPGLPTLGYAMDINNAGQVAATIASGAYGYAGGYIWQNGQVTSLPLALAYRINNAGQVAGTVQTDQLDYTGNYVHHAALWSNGSVRDLGTLGGVDSQPLGLNDLGVVVGQADTDHALSLGGTYPAVRAVFWDGAGIHDIGAGDMSSACGINNLGQIVGGTPTPDMTSAYAFLYANGQVLNLNDLIATGSGWSLVEADGINDAGQIVGNGYFQGTKHAFLLTPVPEPVSVALVGLGGVAVMMRRRSTKK